jgi:hypothetical protein
MPSTVPGILPSELVPHEDRAPLSGPLAPLQLSTGVPGRAERRLSPPVSPTSTLSRGCLDPPTTMDSLSVRRGALPGRPGLHPTEPPCSASFTYFEAFPFARPFLQRWVAPPPQAVALGFLPLRSFAPPTPRILDPPGPEDRTRPFARRLRRATRRTVDPSSRVRPPRVREALEQTSSTKHQPLTDWAAPPLDGDSFSHGLEPPSAPGVLTFRASKCVGSGASPQRSACSLEVSCLFASLVTLVCAPALASP